MEPTTEDWAAEIERAYTVFGFRRWIPNINMPEFEEEEHPREAKGQGKRSGRFARKIRASTKLKPTAATPNINNRGAPPSPIKTLKAARTRSKDAKYQEDAERQERDAQIFRDAAERDAEYETFRREINAVNDSIVVEHFRNQVDEAHKELRAAARTQDDRAFWDEELLDRERELEAARESVIAKVRAEAAATKDRITKNLAQTQHLSNNVEVRGDPEDPVVKEHLEDLAHIPEALKKKLADMGLKTLIHNGPVTDILPELEEDIPRGWEKFGKTWKDVPGIHDTATGTAIAGGLPSGDKGTSSFSLLLHEYGHGADYTLGNPSRSEEFKAMHAAVDWADPYHAQAGDAGPEEAFAELFSLIKLPPAEREEWFAYLSGKETPEEAAQIRDIYNWIWKKVME